MTAAVSDPSFTHGSARRIAPALVLSAIVHLLLVQSLVFEATQRVARPVSAGVMTVRIESPAITGSDSPVIVEAAPLRAGARDSSRDVAPARTGGHATRNAAVPPALPLAPDPTYYSARDLDFYPRPAVPLELDRIARGVEEGIAARFRLLLQIDERGVVNDIKVIEAHPPGRLQEELRAMLAATHFLPGQKDGHAVRSRVTLNVSFDPSRPESASR